MGTKVFQYVPLGSTKFQFKNTAAREEAKMSRQLKMALTMMETQTRVVRPAPRTVRSHNGFVIDLDDMKAQQVHTCVHVADCKDELVVHIRKFRNGSPTQCGVSFNHQGWKDLIEELPQVDKYVRSGASQGIPKVLLAFDSERSVMIINGGNPTVQVIFQRDDKHIMLNYHQWVALIQKQDLIKKKIIEHMCSLINKLEANS